TNCVNGNVRSFARLRSWRRFSIGLSLSIAVSCCMLLGIPERLFVAWQTGSFFRYLPTWSLCRFARRGSGPAMDELMRRSKDGLLHSDDVELIFSITDGPLVVEKGSAAQSWIDLLAELEQADRLSQSQRNKYFMEITDPDLEARKRVRYGDC